jgi:hypothetical protein
MLTMRQSLSAALAAVSLLLTACEQKQSQHSAAENAANAAQQQPGPSLPLPAPEPPLDRENLLIAALRAASNFSAGVDDSKLQGGLVDKNFEFRIRFGCGGPGKEGAEKPLDWTFNDKTAVLKVRATPGLSPKDAAVKAIAGEAFETVEGFWVSRPWLLSPVCPKQTTATSDQQQPVPINAKAAAAAVKKGQAKAPPEPATPEAPPQSVGIAQFFTATGPRTMRRSGRPYETTKRLDDGQPPSGGFDLVLTGRLSALPDGRVIACTLSDSSDQPACVISVEFGKVSIERADTHEQIAQWGPG